MTIEELLQGHGYEGIILLKNPDFVEAFVGVSIFDKGPDQAYINRYIDLVKKRNNANKPKKK